MKKLIVAALLAYGTASATVTTTGTFNSYACNGGTTAFPVTFPFLASTDLVVTNTNALGSVIPLSLGPDYTVAGSTLTTTGAVSPCGNGNTLTIRRATPLTQPLSLRTQGPFSPKALETAYDRLTLGLQQVNATAAANYVALQAQIATVVTGNANALNGLSTVTATGGSTARTLASRFADVTSVSDYGVLCDNSSDDTSRINAALGAGGTVRFPRGATCLVSGVSVTVDGTTIDLNGSTLKQLAGTSGTPVLTISGRTRVVVANGTIDGNRHSVTGNGSHGVLISGSSRVRVENVVVNEVRRIGVFVSGNSTDVSLANVHGAGLGISLAEAGGATVTGSLIQATAGCQRIAIENASVTSIAQGVGMLLQGLDGLSIANFTATDIVGDNGITIDSSSNVAVRNVRISGTGNIGFEFSSTSNYSIENVDAQGNALYGLMLSPFHPADGTHPLAYEQPTTGGRISGVHTAGNATYGVFLVGAQLLDISGIHVEDSLRIQDSFGGVTPSQYITVRSSRIVGLQLAASDTAQIRLVSVDATFPVPGPQYTVDSGPSMGPLTAGTGVTLSPSPNAPTSYMVSGTVHLTGTLTSAGATIAQGDVLATITTVSHRPNRTVLIPSVDWNTGTVGYVIIGTDGSVKWSTSVSPAERPMLDGISYRIAN